MISLILQQNNSENIVVNKELVNVTTTQATLKEPTNITSPTFLLRLDSLPNFNYISCAELNRKYFVVDITANNGLWAISCECDVLSSFKDQLLTNKAIVKRQESKWNLLYNDGTFRTYQNPHIITKTFPNGFLPNSPTFVIAVAGGAEDIETEETTVE